MARTVVALWVLCGFLWTLPARTWTLSPRGILAHQHGGYAPRSTGSFIERRGVNQRTGLAAAKGAPMDADPRSLDGIDVSAARKVLSLYNEGLLTQAEVDLYFEQIAEVEKDRLLTKETKKLSAKQRADSAAEDSAASLNLIAGSGALAAVVGTALAGEAAEVGATLGLVAGSGLAAVAATRDDWVGSAARWTGKLIGKATKTTAVSVQNAALASAGSAATAAGDAARGAVQNAADAAAESAKASVASAAGFAVDKITAVPKAAAKAAVQSAGDAVKEVVIEQPKRAVKELVVERPKRALKELVVERPKRAVAAKVKSVVDPVARLPTVVKANTVDKVVGAVEGQISSVQRLSDKTTDGLASAGSTLRKQQQEERVQTLQAAGAAAVEELSAVVQEAPNVAVKSAQKAPMGARAVSESFAGGFVAPPPPPPLRPSSAPREALNVADKPKSTTGAGLGRGAPIQDPASAPVEQPLDLRSRADAKREQILAQTRRARPEENAFQPPLSGSSGENRRGGANLASSPSTVDSEMQKLVEQEVPARFRADRAATAALANDLESRMSKPTPQDKPRPSTATATTTTATAAQSTSTVEPRGVPMTSEPEDTAATFTKDRTQRITEGLVAANAPQQRKTSSANKGFEETDGNQALETSNLNNEMQNLMEKEAAALFQNSERPNQ